MSQRRRRTERDPTPPRPLTDTARAGTRSDDRRPQRGADRPMTRAEALDMHGAHAIGEVPTDRPARTDA